MRCLDCKNYINCWAKKKNEILNKYGGMLTRKDVEIMVSEQLNPHKDCGFDPKS